LRKQGEISAAHKQQAKVLTGKNTRVAQPVLEKYKVERHQKLGPQPVD
jgi:hypothetical protein